MASELATQIEPLIHIASMSLMDVNSFLTTLTGVKLKYDQLQQKEPKTEHNRPRSASVHLRSLSEEPDQKPHHSYGSTSQHFAIRLPHWCYSSSPESLLGNSRTPSPASFGHPSVCQHASVHRNSVGSIDTETFGKKRTLMHTCGGVIGPLQLPRAPVVDSSLTLPRTSAYSDLQAPPWSSVTVSQTDTSKTQFIGSGVTVLPSDSSVSVSADHVNPLSS